MSKQQGKYELLKEDTSLRKKHTYIQGCLLVALCAMSSVAVYATWTMIYRQNLIIPPTLIDIPSLWPERQRHYTEAFQSALAAAEVDDDGVAEDGLFTNGTEPDFDVAPPIKEMENERIMPSKFGNFIAASQETTSRKVNGDNGGHKIVCYYTTPAMSGSGRRRRSVRSNLYPDHIDPYLCTHLNVGIAEIVNGTVYINDDLRVVFNHTRQLKKANRELKVLVWVGGAGVGGFSEMVVNHASRKLFIQSLKATLEQYQLDGVDLDWDYADYVNIMTYDYHFYAKEMPQTGFNAPLYRRHDEHAIFGTLNINASVHYWLSQGLAKNKLVIGLPTYGHTFQLVSPFNTRIGAPASSYGRVGMIGFASYSEICWFRRHNIYVHQVYDVEACSPCLYAGTEWISYEDERSLECKANYIKENGFGGAMIFSLNTDDFGENYCADNLLLEEEEEGDGDGQRKSQQGQNNFPLLRKIHSVLAPNQQQEQN
ncbi:hypothetical protein quinque_005496 [Culex quinquefasciatus]